MEMSCLKSSTRTRVSFETGMRLPQPAVGETIARSRSLLVILLARSSDRTEPESRCRITRPGDLLRQDTLTVSHDPDTPSRAARNVKEGPLSNNTSMSSFPSPASKRGLRTRIYCHPCPGPFSTDLMDDPVSEISEASLR